MNEALPIGNGTFGGLVFGKTASEKVIIDVDSLWTGNDNPSGDYETNFGSYQMLADLLINLPGHDQKTNYRRDLDIEQSLAHVVYDVDGVRYQREYFCSHPDHVMVIRLTASKGRRSTGRMRTASTITRKSSGTFSTTT